MYNALGYRLMSLRIFAAGLLALGGLLSVVSGRDRDSARDYFQKARQQHEILLRQPESSRTLSQYNKVIFLYRRVIDEDPAFGGADDSLFFTAQLYDEMGRRFNKQQYVNRAEYYYRFVARDYPATRHRAEAQKRALALKRPPATATAEDVEPVTPQSVIAVPPGAVSQVSEAPADKPAVADLPGLATLSSIRYWSNEDYTRVVIQLDREVEVLKEVLSNPARLYLDFQSCRLKSGQLARTYDVNDLFIKQIRVAKNRPGVIRVVLDYEDINTHAMFVLYDPFRIIVDTRGESRKARVATPKAESPQKMQTAEAVIPMESNASDKKEVRKETPILPSPARQGDMSLTRVLGLKVGRVVIDPGHGGKDTGSIGPTGLLEKELVLDVALRLKKLLEERLGTDVMLTRAGDEFVPLEERTAIANQHGADLFVSIHANSSRSRRVSGAETFFLSFASTDEERDVASRENAASQRNIHELENLLRQIALTDYHTESRQLAGMVQTNLWTQMKPFQPRQKNRGVKKAPFIVLIGANMPSILTEIGFISNVSDEKFLKQDSARTTLAEALYKGVEEYFRALGTVPLYERTAVGK
ncbi:MAG: AMIN domain-containing protein [Acidobacteria bacterium]|nr:MAG: AMIN domain-containing protein [Acidobacteriota bacterium]